MRQLFSIRKLLLKNIKFPCPSRGMWCGQQNKKMNLQETIETLTQECIKFRKTLNSISEEKEKEKIVLKHIKKWADSDNCVNNFQKGLEWFNVSKGLSMSEHLAGKIVVLDFFTYCCINCMHILPDLDALEKKYTINDGLVVIGVHSAKFSNEKDSGNILSAVQRYKIDHPVVNDAKLSMWRDIGIVCWPSLVILGPKAQPLFVLVGEGHRDELFIYTKVALSYFKSQKQISNHELPLKPAQHLLPITRNVLLFPGKVTSFSSSNGDKIVISDTGNNRIIISTCDGKVEDIIGGYSPAFKDGNYEEARFNAPQGVCVLNDYIYVADNENHAIRQIDMKKRAVTTLAGNGKQGHDYVGGKNGKEQVLSSPWDVAIYYHEQNDGKKVPIIMIAIAGTHQLWALFLEDTIWWKNKIFKKGTCSAIVGSGKEENRNNSYPHASGLAQPSGIAIVQSLKAIFFADSESSSIRRVHLQDGKVSAVAGADRNPSDLHNYGDIDGIKFTAKLQHPLGVTWCDNENKIYVADTYNGKIKCVDPDGKCTTAFGAGKPSKDFTFNEPSGLTILPTSGDLIVADTNNHCIKIINRKDKKISILSLTLPETCESIPEKLFEFPVEISNEEARLKISFDPKFTDGIKFNSDAPQTWSMILPDDWSNKKINGRFGSSIDVTIPKENTQRQIHIILNLIVCKTDECIPKKLKIILDLSRKSNGPAEINVQKELLIK
ncbi:hypothetical protein HCN44_004498 [Aphidius gifuensis]|uniref:Thioredoxin-like fold domain-containing protein n=2 Tax=Aphidius gifuensis TaxID=684658 RepID=A0A834Y1V2_APHGI|nr:hypothetical protein HCN44_004498 [Aphidius gifuensis]